MVPIIIHYYIDHRVTFEEDRALFPLKWTCFTAPQCHLVATVKYTIYSLKNSLYNYEHLIKCKCNDRSMGMFLQVMFFWSLFGKQSFN